MATADTAAAGSGPSVTVVRCGAPLDIPSTAHHPGATRVDVNNGRLTVLDATGRNIAGYASGYWASWAIHPGVPSAT